MPSRPPRILVSAGEPSGDLHGGAVVEALRARMPGATIDAFGGPRMAAAGATMLDRMERYSVLGVAEVLTKIPAHLALLRRLRARLRGGAYDLVLPIDYPGFNLRLAEAAREAGARVLFYIAPQLWAWRPGRARRLAAAVDRLAVVLPFEREFFGELGVKADFVGHPLAERPGCTDFAAARAAAREALGLKEGPILGVFPGSRRQELARHWVPFRDAAARLLAEGRCAHAVVAATSEDAYPDPGPVRVVRGDSALVFAASDVALAKSGTTTLEAAQADVPMVVAYRMHPLTWALFERVRTVDRVGLVNLVAGRTIAPELLQDRATAAGLAEAAGTLLADPAASARQREGLALVRERLGAPGAAGRVAEIAAELLGA